MSKAAKEYQYEDELEQVCTDRVCERCKGEVTQIELILFWICSSCYDSRNQEEEYPIPTR